MLPPPCLVSSVKFLNEQRDLAKKFAQAHAELTDWIAKNPEEAQRLIKAELLEETRSDMSPQVITAAWKRIVFTAETPRASVEKFMQNSVKAGFIKTAPDLVQAVRKSLMSLQEELAGSATSEAGGRSCLEMVSAKAADRARAR